MRFARSVITTLLFVGTASAFVGPQSKAMYMSMLRASVMEPPPVTEAPGAGYVPEWEGRTGLPPDEFMKSDLSKPDLSEMWECPLTRWDSEGYVPCELVE
jgi:hypothetical protein